MLIKVERKTYTQQSHEIMCTITFYFALKSLRIYTHTFLLCIKGCYNTLKNGHFSKINIKKPVNPQSIGFYRKVNNLTATNETYL